jgi:hypothetical protein
VLGPIGCNQGPKTVPVSGIVTVDGQPLTGPFTVVFIPDKDKGNTIEMDCSTRLGQGGKYTLQTDDRYAQYGGCPPGWYKAVLGSPNDEPIPVNPKYLDIKTALGVEVVADPPPGHYDLKFTK